MSNTPIQGVIDAENARRREALLSAIRDDVKYSHLLDTPKSRDVSSNPLDNKNQEAKIGVTTESKPELVCKRHDSLSFIQAHSMQQDTDDTHGEGDAIEIANASRMPWGCRDVVCSLITKNPLPGRIDLTLTQYILMSTFEHDFEILLPKTPFTCNLETLMAIAINQETTKEKVYKFIQFCINKGDLTRLEYILHEHSSYANKKQIQEYMKNRRGRREYVSPRRFLIQSEREILKNNLYSPSVIFVRFLTEFIFYDDGIKDKRLPVSSIFHAFGSLVGFICLSNSFNSINSWLMLKSSECLQEAASPLVKTLPVFVVSTFSFLLLRSFKGIIKNDIITSPLFEDIE